jgi:Leucine-rich repeat (LRR) protein
LYNLVEIHHSVGFLDKLVWLNLKGCYNLSSFPRILKLRSLQYLTAHGCSSLNDFPEIDCKMKHLKSINFRGIGIKELPSSIRDHIGLEFLYLEGCINLTNLSSSIYLLQDLRYLFLRGCSIQSMLSNVSMKESKVSSHPKLLSLLFSKKKKKNSLIATSCKFKCI